MTEPLGAIKQMALVETYYDRKRQQVLVRDSFPITPSFGVVWYRELNLGFPEVRASVQDRPQADGTFDQTRYTGSRLITLSGVVLADAFETAPVINNWPSDIKWNSASWWCSQLASWAAPYRRYRLYVTDDSGESRFMDVRGDSFDSGYDRTSRSYREFQLGMVNPSGKIYSFASGPNASDDGFHVRKIIPRTLTEFGLPAGRTYPEIGPYTRNYPPSIEGSEYVLYQGSVPTGLIIGMYSGVVGLTGPRVTVISPDGTRRSIGLSLDYTIPPFNNVRFDTTQHTVTRSEVGSTEEISLTEHLAAPLQWPQLMPGINYGTENVTESQRGYNRFEYTSASTAPPSDVYILYNDAHLA